MEKLKKLLAGLRLFFAILWFDAESWFGKIKRRVWNRGIKLWWHRLWVRKDEFHRSLDIDINAVMDMSQEQMDAYYNDLAKRRQIAHERDLDHD